MSNISYHICLGLRPLAGAPHTRAPTKSVGGKSRNPTMLGFDLGTMTQIMTERVSYILSYMLCYII